MKCESKVYVVVCPAGELVAFVPPRKLGRFDPRNVTRFPPIGKRI